MIREQIDAFVELLEKVDAGDGLTRKRVEALKEKLAEKLEALRGRRDDMVTLEEIGIDQIIVDEAQEFRKLTFATNQTNLKGVDPDGSQRAWDLFVKTRFLKRKGSTRALIQASGSPLVNTLGEMFTLLQFQIPEALEERGVHQFDAWAAVFGDTTTELELQPSGAYKPVTRFATFTNLAELSMMFRSIADVVQKQDLKDLITLPRIKTGQRQIITAAASPAFRAYQRHLAERLAAIKDRKGRVQKGDDIHLAVITDGRHAAIDMRLVRSHGENEPANKLNALIANVHRIWTETAALTYLRPDGTPYPLAGAGQLIFSDLGTLSVAATRGFSAYMWVKQSLIARGVPAEQIAFMQDYRKTSDKQRIFAAFREGRVRILIGSSDTMGTGANVQVRLKALHHLDVPWLPSTTLGWPVRSTGAVLVIVAVAGATCVRRATETSSVRSSPNRLITSAGFGGGFCAINGSSRMSQNLIRRNQGEVQTMMGWQPLVSRPAACAVRALSPAVAPAQSLLPCQPGHACTSCGPSPH